MGSPRSGSLSRATNTRLKLTKSPKQYVVWNGSVERQHVEADLNYAMVTSDFETVSIRELKSLLTRDDFPVEHILVFGCEPGGTCYSTGRGGAFTLAYLKHFAFSKTLRKLITQVNGELEMGGYNQRAEVVCREDLLDVPIKNSRVDRTALLQLCNLICAGPADR